MSDTAHLAPTGHHQQIRTSNHLEKTYDHTGRWSSYWIQIAEVLALDAQTVLEVGVGNHVTSDYLRRVMDVSVATVDIKPDLEPTVVANVTNLPFDDRSFDCVIACQVLEHLPYPEAMRALTELRRVARTAVISVPNTGFVMQARILIGHSRVRRTFKLELPAFRRLRSVSVPEHHHWELEVQGFPEKKFRADIERAGWKIVRSYRNPDHTYHHFYVLR